MPGGESAPLPIKVVLLTMFELGEDEGDAPGEFQTWVERFPLPESLPFPQGYRDLRINRAKGVLGIVTGVGTARSAASIMARDYCHLDLGVRQSRERSEKSRGSARRKRRHTAMRYELSRRALLATVGAGAALGTLPGRVFAQDSTQLEFVVWNYSLETIQDNIKKFEAANPGVKVGLTDYTWPDYFDTMMLRFRGSTPTDIMYCGEDWLPGWALAGWLVPIEDHFPEIAKYKDKVANYAVHDMTYNGKLYGLPYYADLITFQYNRKILEDHRIPVPQDWDEVLDACLKLKQAGMEKPIVYEYNQTLPNFYQAFVSQVYGRGGQMFDDQLDPLFNDPQSEAFKHLQWLQDAVTEHDIIAFENHESRVIPAMNTGKHAFSVLFNYVLAAMNERATQPLAGQFAMALMPGQAHACLGFCKFYAMTSQAAEDPARREASWKFIEFMGGGDYQVAKRWAVEKGLGFAQLPLFDDPDVQQAWSSWIDVDTFKQQAELAINGTQTEWLGMWSGFFRPLMAKAFVGEASVAEVMDTGAQRWLELRKLVRGS